MKSIQTKVLIMVATGLFGFGIMVFELLKAIRKIINETGVSAVFVNGRLQHGVGELLIFVPFFLLLLFGKIWTKEKVFALAKKLNLLMISGSLLNASALFYTLGDKEDWVNFFRLWCLVLFIFGMFAPSLAKCLIRKDITVD